ncbi:MAG: DegV family EDD domain-containing protein [Actinobacteria bacterium]|nr:DegV family EDD domain-containing protein [Actinomycetota bacterium]
MHCWCCGGSSICGAVTARKRPGNIPHYAHRHDHSHRHRLGLRPASAARRRTRHHHRAAHVPATLQAAEQGAKEAGVSIPIRFVDSRSASMGEGINVLAAARLAASASNIDDLAAQVRSLAERTRVWGALDTLENLKKNGRIGGAKALLASALAIKPIITVKDGKVAEGGKQRTRSKALEFVIEQFRNDGAVSNVAVLHAECSDVDAFVARLRETYKGEIVVGNIGSVIGSHTGPGTIGVTYHTA